MSFQLSTHSESDYALLATLIAPSITAHTPTGRQFVLSLSSYGGLGDQLRVLKLQLVELEGQYEGKRVRPHSKLAQARRHKATWERQLRSALEDKKTPSGS